MTVLNGRCTTRVADSMSAWVVRHKASDAAVSTASNRLVTIIACQADVLPTSPQKLYAHREWRNIARRKAVLQLHGCHTNACRWAFDAVPDFTVWCPPKRWPLMFDVVPAGWVYECLCYRSRLYSR